MLKPWNVWNFAVISFANYSPVITSPMWQPLPPNMKSQAVNVIPHILNKREAYNTHTYVNVLVVCGNVDCQHFILATGLWFDWEKFRSKSVMIPVQTQSPTDRIQTFHYMWQVILKTSYFFLFEQRGWSHFVTTENQLSWSYKCDVNYVELKTP